MCRFGLVLWCFNSTFNNISVSSWWSALLVEETGLPGENHRPVVSHWRTLSHNVMKCVKFKSEHHNAIEEKKNWGHTHLCKYLWCVYHSIYSMTGNGWSYVSRLNILRSTITLIYFLVRFRKFLSITGVKLMFVTGVTYIPTWRTRKMVN